MGCIQPNSRNGRQNELLYLGITLESSGGWNRQELKTTANGNQILTALD
jgi:hypothetical protein